MTAKKITPNNEMSINETLLVLVSSPLRWNQIVKTTTIGFNFEMFSQPEGFLCFLFWRCLSTHNTTRMLTKTSTAAVEATAVMTRRGSAPCSRSTSCSRRSRSADGFSPGNTRKRSHLWAIGCSFGGVAKRSSKDPPPRAAPIARRTAPPQRLGRAAAPKGRKGRGRRGLAPTREAAPRWAAPFLRAQERNRQESQASIYKRSRHRQRG